MADHDFWTDLLSEHLDGHLPAERSRALAEHLATCEGCRRVEAELVEVKRRARALGGIEPPDGLWDRIQERLEQTPGVVDLTLRLDPALSPAPQIPDSRKWGRPLRVAAMIALLVATGTTGWALGAGSAPEAERVVEGRGTAGLSAELEALPAASVSTGDELARAVAELDRLLQARPEGLDVNTVGILRRNLTLIQTAVAESRDALAANPDNAYVRRHLEGAVERQRAFVQQAARLLAADD